MPRPDGRARNHNPRVLPPANNTTIWRNTLKDGGLENMHPVDAHVGKQIRQRRWLLGMTQNDLASKTGVKFQQIQKYETGANRVSASRLWQIAKVLDVQVSYFFEDMPSDRSADTVAIKPDLFSEKETLQLIRSYYLIPERSRHQLFQLAKVLSA